MRGLRYPNGTGVIAGVTNIGENHVLGEVAGQLAPTGHEDMEVLQLGDGGQLAEELKNASESLIINQIF